MRHHLSLAVLVVLLSGSVSGAAEFYWGPTGFPTSGLNSTWICRPVKATRGVGTLVLAGSAEVPSVSGEWATMRISGTYNAPDAYFWTAGIRARLQGVTPSVDYFYRVYSKTSDDSVLVTTTTDAPTLDSGSATDWEWWNTLCYYDSAGGAITVPTSVIYTLRTPMEVHNLRGTQADGPTQYLQPVSSWGYTTNQCLGSPTIQCQLINSPNWRMNLGNGLNPSTTTGPAGMVAARMMPSNRFGVSTPTALTHLILPTEWNAVFVLRADQACNAVCLAIVQ